MWILEDLWETGGRDPRIFKFGTDARVCVCVFRFMSNSFYIPGSFNRHPYMRGSRLQQTRAIRNQHNVRINVVASFCRVRFELNISTRWVVQQCNNVLLTFDKSTFVQYVPSIKRNCKTVEGGVHSGKDTNYLRCESQSVLQPPAIVYTLIENREYCLMVTLWWRLQVRL
jgi:hypothetical protein